MREPVKDRGRIENMLEMAQNLSAAKTQHSFSDIKDDRILFYGILKNLRIRFRNPSSCLSSSGC